MGVDRQASEPKNALGHWLNLSRRECYGASIIGLLVCLAFAQREILSPDPNTPTDFMAFYAGAKLAGTPNLYDSARVRGEQIKALGAYGAGLQYVRLPFYAGLLSPLARLPYRAAIAVWQCISILAMLGFVLLWRIPDRATTVLACGWSLPVIMVFLLAQDVTLLLFLLALAVRLADREKPVASGLLLSLLSIKFNLFLLLPVLLFGQRLWKIAAGFALGCVMLILASFWVGGANWPVQLAKTLSSPVISPREFVMPNLRGLLSLMTDRLWPEVVCAVTIVAALLFVIRRADFHLGLAGTIVGSLLVSHHAGPQDCALLLPAILILIANASGNATEMLCLAMISPIPYVFLILKGPSVIGQVSIMILFAAIVIRSGSLRAEPGVRTYASGDG
jgi:hypothetical protein